jgi:ATP-dependent exoDNAse (exonuclease V) beta subunit
MLLSKLNQHERDSRISFQEEGHLYTVDGVTGDYISTTTIIHTFFEHFDAEKIIYKMMMNKEKWKESKYFGMEPEEIKKQWEDIGNEASHKGTIMHAAIERFYNQERIDNCPDEATPEFHHFLKFHQEIVAINSFSPYRTEWLVFDHESKICGSVDMVFQKSGDAEDEIYIYDWKRSKEMKLKSFGGKKGNPPLDHIMDCNYMHYCLQLNMYRHILETYYQKKVKDMVLVVMHPIFDSYKTFQVPRMEKEIMDIIEYRKKSLIS